MKLRATKSSFPFLLVQGDLKEIETELLKQGAVFEPSVEGYISYVLDTGGKRIRPALAVLGGGATGGVTADHRKLGLVLELIHMASLVHDDIMDGADLRRNRPTPNAKWGNALCVLLGDSLFARALELANEFEDRDISTRIAVATRQVCTGEIIQTQRRFDLNLSVEEYYRILELKTAALFSAATELSAKLNHASPEKIEALREFGRLLGVAYQVYDDCLDLTGTEKSTGKTLGTDLQKGKLTLPLIHLFRDATEAQRGTLSRLLLQKEPVEVAVLAGIADYAGALDKSVKEATAMVAQAARHLEVLEPGNYRDALEKIPAYLARLLRDCRPARG